MKLKHCFPIFFLIVFCLACQNTQETFIEYTNDQISYEGRVDKTGSEAAELFWPGTSITINFEGKEIGAWLKDETGDNYYNIIIDQDSIYQLNPDTAKRLYLLADNLADGPHTIEIFKRTSWDKGRAWFYGFEITEGKLLAPPPPKALKIEFYGNSITTGYAMEDLSGEDSPAGKFENNYLTYAAITARHFNAAYSCIAKAGIGVMVSWFPLIMPEIYNRLDPQDSASLWDFSQYTPDIVVVNLFQNDSWIVNMPEHEQFIARFGTEKPDEAFIVNSYAQFIQSIRKAYPEADIICTLGNMDATKSGSPWPGYVEAAVASVDDQKLYTHFFPDKETPGHPKAEEQQVMAESLIRFIEDNIL